MGLMFGLSTDAFSSAHTAPFTTFIFLKFMPQFAALTVETVDLVVRKTAHLSEYFIFGILLTHLFKKRSGLSTSSQIIWAIALGIIYAISDEFHQSFVPSRTPSAGDVVIDTIGFVCGTFSYTYVAIRQGKMVPTQNSTRQTN
jgi:VanZ family protein